MNPNIAKAFNILRELVPSKGKLIHSHNGYSVYDLENIRVGIDADENHDTVNYLDGNGLTGWTIGRLDGQDPKIVYNLYRFTPEEMVEIAARHADKRS
mgnify:CR=1 FL=1